MAMKFGYKALITFTALNVLYPVRTFTLSEIDKIINFTEHTLVREKSALERIAERIESQASTLTKEAQASTLTKEKNTSNTQDTSATERYAPTRQESNYDSPADEYRPIRRESDYAAPSEDYRPIRTEADYTPGKEKGIAETVTTEIHKLYDKLRNHPESRISQTSLDDEVRKNIIKNNPIIEERLETYFPTAKKLRDNYDIPDYMDMNWYFALMRRESSLDKDVVNQDYDHKKSKYGATGLFQFIPSTAESLEPGITQQELKNPVKNMTLGWELAERIGHALHEIDGFDNLSTRRKQQIAAGAWYTGEGKMVAIGGNTSKLNHKAKEHMTAIDEYLYGG